LFAVLISATLTLPLAWEGDLALRWLPFLAFALLLISGKFLQAVKWPGNDFIEAVKDIVPPEMKAAAEEEEEEEFEIPQINPL
jgi:hypothetical protein